MAGYLAYIRVSTVKQGEHGTSLIEQRSAIESYAHRNGLSVDAWFEEMQSAGKQGRRQFTRMFSELHRTGARGVIFYKIDRGARNLKDWAQIGELIDAGVDIRVAHESLDLTTRAGRLSADILAVIATDFLRNQRQDVRNGIQGRYKQGLFPLPAPRGYADQGRGKPKCIHPVHGPLVRQAFDLYATGTYTFDTLRHELHSRGLRTRGGRPLALQSMSKMLRNPFYIGIIQTKDGRTFQGIHEPLIRKSTFDRAQAVADGRFFARPQRHDLTFRRMIRCGACGYALTGEVQKGHAYYRCHVRACRGTSMREEAIDRAIQEQLESFQFTDEEFADFKDLAREALAGDLGAKEDRRANLRRDLALCEDRLARLTDALLDALIDKPTFEMRKASLLQERLALREAIEVEDSDDVGEQVIERFDQLRTRCLGYGEALPEEKRKVVRAVASDLLARGKHLEVAVRPEFLPLLAVRSQKNFEPQKSP